MKVFCETAEFEFFEQLLEKLFSSQESTFSNLYNKLPLNFMRQSKSKYLNVLKFQNRLF